jgi:hypothetical protein
MRLQPESVVLVVNDIDAAVTDFGARVAVLSHPFGSSLGLNQAKRSSAG